MGWIIGFSFWRHRDGCNSFKEKASWDLVPSCESEDTNNQQVITSHSILKWPYGPMTIPGILCLTKYDKSWNDTLKWHIGFEASDHANVITQPRGRHRPQGSAKRRSWSTNQIWPAELDFRHAEICSSAPILAYLGHTLIDQHGQRECQQEEEKLCDGSTSDPFRSILITRRQKDLSPARLYLDLLCPVLESKAIQVV